MNYLRILPLFVILSTSALASDANCPSQMAFRDLPFVTHDVSVTVNTPVLFPREIQTVLLFPEMLDQQNFISIKAKEASPDLVRSLKRTLKLSAKSVVGELEEDNYISFDLFTKDDPSIDSISGEMFLDEGMGPITLMDIETTLSRNALTFHCEPKPVIEM